VNDTDTREYKVVLVVDDERIDGAPAVRIEYVDAAVHFHAHFTHIQVDPQHQVFTGTS
jgi:hypothetical protein